MKVYMPVLVTNNPLVESIYRDSTSVEYKDESLSSLLVRVRDHVHGGRRLLTHPLSGSVKPNETPYKSVLISDKYNDTDTQSVQIIEECLSAVRKFPPKPVPEDYLQDLQEVDLSLIRDAIDRDKRS